jgi:uncharacterized RDD family membrane protein YckC
MESPQQAPSAATGPSGPRAGFFHRLAAIIVDGLILGVVGFLLTLVFSEEAANGVGILIALVYFAYLEGSGSGQTVGKRALGIRVIDFRSGGPIGFGRGLIRYVSRILSTIPCGLGYLWMLWDREKQTWHDKLANTVVVPVSDYPVDSWPG